MAVFPKSIPGPHVGLLPLPYSAQASYASATGTAGAQVQVSIPATANLLGHVTGFTITTGPPSGNSPLVGLVTLTDGTWTMNWQITETVSAGGWMHENFPYPLIASGVNIALTLTLPAIAGGGVSAIALQGYLI